MYQIRDFISNSLELQEVYSLASIASIFWYPCCIFAQALLAKVLPDFYRGLTPLVLEALAQ